MYKKALICGVTGEDGAYLSKLLLMNISPYVENRHSIKQTLEFLRTIQ